MQAGTLSFVVTYNDGWKLAEYLQAEQKAICGLRLTTPETYLTDYPNSGY